MMNPALAGLIARYQPRTSKDYENAVREIVQEIALLGLWRTPYIGFWGFRVEEVSTPESYTGGTPVPPSRGWRGSALRKSRVGMDRRAVRLSPRASAAL